MYDALIEAGCDINHKNISGQTAFDHWQSENNSIVGKYTHWESKNDNYIRFLSVIFILKTVQKLYSRTLHLNQLSCCRYL